MGVITISMPQDYGATACGIYNPLSSLFPTLAQAQAVFPFALDLGESLDRCAIQKCLNNAVAADHLGRLVYLPHGVYVLDQPLYVDTAFGLVLQGCGGQSVLSWQGRAVEPALRLVLCQDCTFADFTVRNDLASAWGVGVWLTNRTGTSDSVVSDNNLFSRIRVSRFADDVLIHYDQAGGAPDANNDLHVFRDCTFDQYSSSGVRVIGGQSHFLRFEACNFAALTADGTRGLWCEYGAYFHLHQCNLNNNETAVDAYQFYPGVCSLVRCNGENNRRVLTTSYGGGHAGIAPFEVIGCRFAMSQLPGDYVLDFNGQGPFVVRDNTFQATSVQPLTAIRYTAARVEHCNNVYGWNGAWSAAGALAYPHGGSVSSLRDEGNLYEDYTV